MQKHSKNKKCAISSPLREMMHKNFMHRHLRIFVVQCSRMKFYANGVIVSTSPFRRERSAANTRRVFSQEMPISLTSSAVFAPVM